jgi:hypothetical protein
MQGIREDSTGKRFLDVPTLVDEHVRITLVPKEEAGYQVDSMRLQIRDAKGHLRPGPEVPVTAIGDFVKGLVDLLR